MNYVNEIVYSLITLCVALIINFGSLFIYKVLLKGRLNPRRNTITLLFLNIIRYGVLVISLVVIASIFNIDMAALLAGAGFLGILLGLGMQKLFQDMISGFFIIFEDHYIVGDYVTINNVTGEVLEIGLKTTRIKTYEGELYLFSNGSIDHILNYSRFPSLSLVEVHIPYKYNPYNIIEIIRTELKDFEHKMIVSKIDVLGVQGVHLNHYDVRVTCYTKSYEHFAVNRQLKSFIIQRLFEKEIYVNIEKKIEIKKE